MVLQVMMKLTKMKIPTVRVYQRLRNQQILDAEEDSTISRSRKEDEVMMNLTCAAMAVTADEMMKVYVATLSN
jgi:hypothetical protein